MLTILTCETRQYKTKLGSALKILRPNSLSCECAESGGVRVRHLHYISRNGRIRWDKIAARAAIVPGTLVFGSDRELPPDCPIRPFHSTELRSRLCANMAAESIRLMRPVPEKLKVGIFDPAGEIADVAAVLTRLCPSVTVVSRCDALYTTVADRILADCGAAIRLTHNLSAIEKCGLIIAAGAVGEPFHPDRSAVLLTTQKPKLPLPCQVFYRYYFKLAPEYDCMRPEQVDAEYFAQALYTLERRRELSSAVPLVCRGDCVTHTVISLSRYVSNICGCT